MNHNKNKLLTESAVDVLEKVAFLFPIPIEGQMPDGDSAIDEHTTCVGMTFRGPSSGKLFICLPDSLMLLIAANMLGVDEDDPDAEQKSLDATKEVLNIICGNLLPKIYGEKSGFHFSTPYIVENIEGEIFENEYFDISETEFDVENCLVTCVLAVKK